MPPPPNNEDDALFIITVKKGNKLIEELMTPAEKQKTGVAKLLPEELAELNAWLDTGLVVAPGGQPHGPG